MLKLKKWQNNGEKKEKKSMKKKLKTQSIEQLRKL